jgi:hypothetical protein
VFSCFPGTPCLLSSASRFVVEGGGLARASRRSTISTSGERDYYWESLVFPPGGTVPIDAVSIRVPELDRGCLYQWDRQRSSSEGDRGRPVVSRWDRNSEHRAEIVVPFSGFLMPLGFEMAMLSRHHVRSHDATTSYRMSCPARKPRRTARRVAQSGTIRSGFRAFVH